MSCKDVRKTGFIGIYRLKKLSFTSKKCLYQLFALLLHNSR